MDSVVPKLGIISASCSFAALGSDVGTDVHNY